MTAIKDSRPVEFSGALAFIGNTEFTACKCCGATVLRHTGENGDVMQQIHRKWHEQTGTYARPQP